MNPLIHFRAAQPTLTAAAAALLLNAAALASLSQLPTRGERLLAYADTQQLASLDQSTPAALHPDVRVGGWVGHHSLQDRLARLAHRWLGIDGQPTAARRPV